MDPLHIIVFILGKVIGVEIAYQASKLKALKRATRAD